MDLKNYQNPDHEGNGLAYRTGKVCIENGCAGEAGTAWSPHWCQPCNAARMDRIGKSLEGMLRRLEPETA